MSERCGWCLGDPLYLRYHDEEWGVPCRDDRRLFEFLVLEAAQAGLSWLTVLKKRENYRRAYDGFDPRTVAGYGEEKIASLLGDPGIIRNRLKVRASVENARRFLAVQKEFGSFADYLWAFAGGRQEVHGVPNLGAVPCSTALSDRLSADLKKRGFRFAGSVIVYSYLQAVGVVDDHVDGCFCKNRPGGGG